MNLTTIVINALAAGTLLWAVVYDCRRAGRALWAALRSLVGMAPAVLSIIILIGLLLGFVPPETIRRLIGAESGMAGILTAAGIGGLMHIPAIIAFLLTSSLVDGGATVGAAAAPATHGADRAAAPSAVGSPGSSRGVSLRGILTLAALAAEAVLLVTLFPDRRPRVVETSLDSLVEMATILPAVVVLLGLFSVFVKKHRR